MDNHKSKICFVVAADITLKFLLFEELKLFQNKEYKVFAVCSPGKWILDIKKEGIEVKEIIIKRKLFTPISDLISLVELFFYFKKERFDVVLTFTPKPDLLGQLAAKIAGVPIIINTIFGFYFSESTSYLKRKFFIFIEKIAARCSDAILFRNKEDLETAIKEKIGNNALNKYIGDGIDIEKFNNARFSEEFIKEKKERLGIAFRIPVIGIVARLVGEKGYIELFEAHKKVIEMFKDTILLAVGPSDLKKKDSIDPNIVKNFGIENNVMFLGERTDVDELYPLMDVFVLPSYREGFPHSVMEALAMARPVIATDVRGCREAIENGFTGILIPPRNSEKLAEAVIHLLSHPDIAKKMGGQGRIKAEKEFDKRFLLHKMEEIIKVLAVTKFSKL